MAQTPDRRRRGPRSVLAFGEPGGTMPGMGNDPIPKMRTRAPSHNRSKQKRCA